ncbi:uncharacterized protein LOC126549553 isoform X4 [Aphis gossypii]|uniref:uncharacterized protein LOC126549553 isoform X4 n=1 Tax=Aphis gossypii TaxID=80765 RepID=UPI0021593762|nr:uncharacterized protein LOC126549553 isoform X4 [Aphis gossypii]
MKGSFVFKLIPFSKLREKMAKISNSVSENRNHIRLIAESIAYCVVTGGLGWLAYEFHETVLTIERCVQKDPMLLNNKSPEYIFADKTTFTDTSVTYYWFNNNDANEGTSNYVRS